MSTGGLFGRCVSDTTGFLLPWPGLAPLWFGTFLARTLPAHTAAAAAPFDVAVLPLQLQWRLFCEPLETTERPRFSHEPVTISNETRKRDESAPARRKMDQIPLPLGRTSFSLFSPNDRLLTGFGFRRSNFIIAANEQDQMIESPYTKCFPRFFRRRFLAPSRVIRSSPPRASREHKNLLNSLQPVFYFCTV